VSARVAVFAGSFDPVTAGHVDLALRALALADRLVVAVAVNASKQPMFTLEEREALVRDALDEAGAPAGRVDVRRLDGLLVRFAQEAGATLLVRGLRNGSDFDYEAQMAQMNRHVAPALDTVFLAPSPAVGFVSSTLVREVSRLGGDVGALVPPNVAAALARRFPGAAAGAGRGAGSGAGR
jgi:pantetheine-phosphate adenylyltransferase